MNLNYKVQMLSDWHCSSGLTSGADVDLLCIKDANGLPVIPGKTLKGLLREAAVTLCAFDKTEKDWENFIYDIFGVETDKVNEEDSDNDRDDKNADNEVTIFFSSATLSKRVIDLLVNNEKKKDALFRKVASTAINDNGVAKDHTLRKMEVVIPMTLFAQVNDIKDGYKEKLEKCLKLVKRLGMIRNRGLGRCILSVKEVSN